MTRVVKVLTAAAKNKWKQRARRRQLRQRTGYDGPVNLPIGNYRSAPCSLLAATASLALCLQWVPDRRAIHAYTQGTRP